VLGWNKFTPLHLNFLSFALVQTNSFLNSLYFALASYISFHVLIHFAIRFHSLLIAVKAIAFSRFSSPTNVKIMDVFKILFSTFNSSVVMAVIL